MEELRIRVHDHTHPAARSKAQLQDGHGQAQFLDRATPGEREIVLHCQAEGCTFSTLKSSDSTALVKHLDIHTRSVHGAVVSDNDGRVDEREYSRPSKENRELQAALATRKISAASVAAGSQKGRIAMVGMAADALVTTTMLQH